jgi:hypothetical protein
MTLFGTELEARVWILFDLIMLQILGATTELPIAQQLGHICNFQE